MMSQECDLITAVTNYVQEEFNRADQLTSDRKTTVGFALTILQRRLASSPEAIYQSLRRRRERLENRLAEERVGKRVAEYTVPAYDDYDDDDLPSSELEDTEENIIGLTGAVLSFLLQNSDCKMLQGLPALAGEGYLRRQKKHKK